MAQMHQAMPAITLLFAGGAAVGHRRLCVGMVVRVSVTVGIAVGCRVIERMEITDECEHRIHRHSDKQQCQRQRAHQGRQSWEGGTHRISLPNATPGATSTLRDNSQSTFPGCP